MVNDIICCDVKKGKWKATSKR